MLKDASITVRIKPSTRQRIDAIAAARKRTRSYLVEEALERYLDSSCNDDQERLTVADPHAGYDAFPEGGDAPTAHEREVKGVPMLALKGIYDHGKISFNRPLKINKPVEVIVTFLQPLRENAAALDLKLFSFDKSRDILASFKGQLSSSVIDERRDAL